MSLKLRKEILSKLLLCTPEQQHIFKRMYAGRRLDLPITDVVENMFKDNLMTALSQVERTVLNNQKKQTTLEIENNNDKQPTKMNITDSTTTAATRDIFEIVEAAKTQGIKGYRINEGEDIWPTLDQRRELRKKGYKLEYGQYETATGEVGFFTMIFFYPPKINAVRTKTISVEIEIAYTSASFKEKEFKKSLTESFNTWGTSGYQIKSLTDIED